MLFGSEHNNVYENITVIIQVLRMFIDRIIRILFSEQQYGAYRFRRYPMQGRAWGGPFNGQKWRCLMVAELTQKLDPIAFVETGTYLGTTTEWLSAFQRPVYSCEVRAENYGFASARLAMTGNVNLFRGDSRAALKAFLEGPLRSDTSKVILFYLDAHWYEDLPLNDEVRMIFEACPKAIVVIDDFKVPSDPGYSYDDYGKGKALTPDYLAEVSEEYCLILRYPTSSSSSETGAKRGCCVVTGPSLEAEMGRVQLLRPPVVE